MTSLAAVFLGPRHIELQKLATPTPASGEILVRVTACTLCASDLHSYEGRREVPKPSILGHEIIGEIVAFGSAAPRHDFSGQPLQLGDVVSWAVVANCGRCFYCQHALPQKCSHAIKYGHEAFQPNRELVGGLAEHCLLVAGTHLIRWPKEFPLSIACPASCATATSVAALSAAKELSGELTGQTVVITGAGMLGLSTCSLARVRGAARVICIDPQPQRREQALVFGAHVATCGEQALQIIREHTDNRGADLMIEMSGAPAAFELGMSCLRTGGSMVLIGSVFPTPPVALAMEQIVRRCLRLAGVHNYGPQHLAAAAQFLIEHGQRFPFAELVSAWYPLCEIARALEAAATPGTIRIGITPS